MDFDRLARELLPVDLSAIARFLMLASAAPLVISLALYCTRDRWAPSLGRLVSPSPEAWAPRSRTAEIPREIGD